jgi:putative DNA primase/helicase
MKLLLGDNMKNGSVAKIENSAFARADLEHQLLMVDDDMSMEALRSTHYLKSLITAETPMDLEKKGVQSYQGDMYCRFMAFSNGDLQALYDHSDGFYRRQLILTTKKKPADRIDDPYLVDKFREELPGIFNWCLGGLFRLRENGYRFTESDSARRSRTAAREDADNIREFLMSEGYIRLKANGCITSSDLCRIYANWCDDNAYNAKSPKALCMGVSRLASEFKLEGNNNVYNRSGKRVRGYWGIEAAM